MNITKLNRNDAGIYTCEAVNSQGSAMINITVVVECKYIYLPHFRYTQVISSRKEFITTSIFHLFHFGCHVPNIISFMYDIHQIIVYA